ncbi:MAG: PilZ domain-containing protein [Myxococcota bacterium]
MENDDFTLGGFADPGIATRYVARIQVVARFGDRALEGSIVDLSNSGVRLEIPHIVVAPGTLVRLELPWFPTDPPASMLAKYVRRTENGCALRFSDPDPFLRVFVKLGLLQSESTAQPRAAASGTRF